jgi:serine/threonine protein kinase
LPNPCAGKWQRGIKIGSGSYGNVYKALDKETGRIFAVKRQELEDRDDDDRRFRDRLEDEITIYKDLRHPHIVSYLGHEYGDGTLNIYLEYVAGGSMSNILSEFGPLDDALLCTSTLGLLEGLNYLHTRAVPIVHRDIKGANILVDLSFCVKLADFGCSKRCSNTRSFTTVGSIPWMAPEVIQQQDGYGRKADVWSLGCTMIEMASADKPWGRDTFDNIVFAMRHIGLSENVPPLPDNISEAGRDLITLCVQRNPDQRPWTSQLLEHPFVKNVAAQQQRKSTRSRPHRNGRSFANFAC